MPEDLTPEHMRCAIQVSCPSIHQLEDGRYLIVGASAEYIGRRASIEDENRIQDYGPGNSYADDQIVWQAYRSPKIAIGPGETAIVISPDLLSSLPEIVRLREENKRLRGDPWQPIETARNIEGNEILALSPAWEDGKRPILLRWFKYNGLEAWRDWDNEPHWPTHWMPIPARSALSSDVGNHPVAAGIEIDYLGGNCPVQAEGRIDGKPFYFRARGMSWSLEIGDEPVRNAEWGYREDWGDEPHAAGWMEESEARRLIEKGAKLFRKASATTSGDRTASTPESPGLNHTSSDGGEG